jgi:2-amino-4-hydroxy-6-hydroxymethyldihydropteridine diphosphokinase
MNTVYLIIGGNIGKREEAILHALRKIDRQTGEIFIKSAIYETAPWGNEDQAKFLNCAIGIKTSKSPHEVLQSILDIEMQMGRIRGEEKWKERLIDIDILFYENKTVLDNELSIPHPFLHQRKFVLTPLNEIAPQFIHPAQNKTVQELLNACKDQLSVEKVHV